MNSSTSVSGAYGGTYGSSGLASCAGMIASTSSIDSTVSRPSQAAAASMFVSPGADPIEMAAESPAARKRSSSSYWRTAQW